MNRAPISRRVALAAASVVVLALSACGNPSSSSGSVPGTLPVIHVAGSAGGERAMNAAMADASASPSKMMANLRFVFGGQVPDLTAPAGSWYFPTGQRASDDALRALAAALGVGGDVVTQPADMGGGRMVGSTDYTGPSVYLNDDALSSWWFNGNPSASSVGCAVAAEVPSSDAVEPVEAVAPPSVDETGGTATDPVPGDTVPVDVPVDVPVVDPMPCEVDPPEGVPTKDEAEAMTRDLLTSLGLDPASYQFETWADDWGANVTGYFVLDGVRTNLTVSTGYGGEGALVWASGFLATPQRGVDYPRIGVEAAVQRLNDQHGSLLRGTGPAVMEAVPADAAIGAPEPAPLCAEPAADTASTAFTDTPCATIDPMPTDMEPIDIEPMIITLADPQPSLEQLWDVDGTVWLVPGYSFSTGDGGTWPVAAIADEYLQIDDAAVDQPVTVDTVTVDTGSGSGGSMVEPVTVPSTVTGDDAWDLSPSGPTSVEQAAAALVGRSLDEAATIPWTVRVVRQDGVDLAVTADAQPQRVNVVVVDGTITEVQSLG